MADLTPISSLEEVERALVQRIAERLGGTVEQASSALPPEDG
jgi:hypothetical protein